MHANDEIATQLTGRVRPTGGRYQLHAGRPVKSIESGSVVQGIWPSIRPAWDRSCPMSSTVCCYPSFFKMATVNRKWFFYVGILTDITSPLNLSPRVAAERLQIAAH